MASKKEKPNLSLNQANTAKSKERTATIKRNYPRWPLEDSLKIVYKIKEYNGGNAWPPSDVAKALESAPKSSDFFYLTAAARDYGLTEGTRDASEIKLTELGRSIAYASDANRELQSKIDAFFSIKVFKDVFDYYGGSNLPELTYLSNTLESTFQLDPQVHAEFISIFKQNCNYLSIGDKQTITQLGGLHATLPTTTIAGPVNKTDKTLTLFVALPFVERSVERPDGFFNEVLNNLIVPAATESGFNVQTANKSGSDIIQSTIINELIEADVVLADLTDHNPNVLFELGFRIALNKPVIIIKAKGTLPIFDVDSMMRYYEYNSNLWKSTLEKDIPKLKEHIDAAWKGKNQQSYIDILTRNK